LAHQPWDGKKSPRSKGRGGRNEELGRGVERILQTWGEFTILLGGQVGREGVIKEEKKGLSPGMTSAAQGKRLGWEASWCWAKERERSQIKKILGPHALPKRERGKGV